MSINRWPTYLLAVLLAGVLVGGAVIQRDAEAAAAGTRRMTIPAAAFTPTTDGADYYNDGSIIHANDGGVFVAPLSFSVDIVRINRITLRAYDNIEGQAVMMGLYRAEPGTGTKTSMAYTYTQDDSDGVQSVSTSHISPNRVGSRQAAFLMVDLRDGPALEFHGVTVEWTPIDP